MMLVEPDPVIAEPVELLPGGEMLGIGARGDLRVEVPFGQRIGQLIADFQMVELLAIGQKIKDENFHLVTSPRRSLWAVRTRYNRNPVCTIVQLALAEGVTRDGWGSPELS